MNSLSRQGLCLICLLALLSGCSSAYTGLSGDTFYSDGLADFAVSPINGMEPVLSGRINGSIPSDQVINPSGKITYAVYGDADGGQSVKRHAHVILAELKNKTNYFMKAETFAKANEVDLRKVKLDRRDWTMHTFYEPRQGDWFTELWDVNGYMTPQTWLGRRWSRSYDQSSRIVVEYREPMPECVRVQDQKHVVILNNITLDMPTPECRREVEAILERADKAFSMRRPATVNTSKAAPSDKLSIVPDRQLDIKRYVGEVEYVDGSMSKD